MNEEKRELSTPNLQLKVGHERERKKYVQKICRYKINKTRFTCCWRVHLASRAVTWIGSVHTYTRITRHNCNKAVTTIL